MSQSTTHDYTRNKTLSIVGAGGKSGQAFVRAALANGFTVRAGFHSRPLTEADGLTPVRCDATNPSDVAKLLQGSSAVVSLIGHVRGSSASVQSDAIRVITGQMKVQGISRIVSLTGTGVRLHGDTPSLMDKIANNAISLVDPQRIHDGIQHAEILKESDLEWSILRVLKLTDLHATPFSLNAHGPAKLFTSREEVAEAILQILETDEWIRTAPIICKPSQL